MAGRRRASGRILAVTVLVALAAACNGSAAEPEPDADSPQPDAPVIQGVQTFTGLSNRHTTEPQTYPQTPPVGGPHFPAQANGVVGWQRCGTPYSAPLVNEFAVHSLEHGAVWLTYSDKATPQDRAQLERLAQIRPEYTLLSPYPDQTSAVTVTAWGLQLSVPDAADPRLADFVRAYAGGGQGGEQGADCANGTALDEAKAALAKG